MAPATGSDTAAVCTAESPVYCVIGNIPSELHSADLRAFFSQLTNLGGFHCFHYRHRPEVNPAEDKSTSTGNTTSTCCCVVSVKKDHLVDLLRNYDKKLWVNRAGKYLRSRARISQLKVRQQPSPATATTAAGEDNEAAGEDDEDAGEDDEAAGEGDKVAGEDEEAAGSSSAGERVTDRLVAARTVGEPSCDGVHSPAGEDGEWRHAVCGNVSTTHASTAVEPGSQLAQSDSVPATPTSSNPSNHTHTIGGSDGGREEEEEGEDSSSFDLAELLKLLELRPPSVLPNGNVGTADSVLLDLIAQCRFPARLIPKLGLSFPKVRRPHLYASVPFQYEHTAAGGRSWRRGSKTPQRQQQGKTTSASSRVGPHSTQHSATARTGDVTVIASKSPSQDSNCQQQQQQQDSGQHGNMIWRTADGHSLCEEVPGSGGDGGGGCHGDRGDVSNTGEADTVTQGDSRKSKNASARADAEVIDIEDEQEEDEEEEDDEVGGDQDDHDAEEWDRHEALHDDVDKQGRTEERLFENEIELKWEKGGSGLVFYTDAAYWDELKGDEDERLADDYNVDFSVFYDPNSGTKDAVDVMDMEMEDKRRAGKNIRDWRGSSRHGNKATGFEHYTEGFAGRVLRGQGWKEGHGLGVREQGIAEPVVAEGQPGYNKQGLGYYGEKLRRDVSGARRPQRHVTTKYDAADFGDTLLRTRGPLAQKRRHPESDGASGEKAAPSAKAVNEEGNVAKINN